MMILKQSYYYNNTNNETNSSAWNKLPVITMITIQAIHVTQIHACYPDVIHLETGFSLFLVFFICILIFYWLVKNNAWLWNVKKI